MAKLNFLPTALEEGGKKPIPINAISIKYIYTKNPWTLRHWSRSCAGFQSSSYLKCPLPTALEMMFSADSLWFRLSRASMRVLKSALMPSFSIQIFSSSYTLSSCEDQVNSAVLMALSLRPRSLKKRLWKFTSISPNRSKLFLRESSPGWGERKDPDVTHCTGMIQSTSI